jgi:PKD repeat protein
LQPWIEPLEKRELLATTLAAPLHFDFGTTTSPVASGYTGVSLVAYSPTLGFGWQSLTGLSAVNRSTADALTSDLVRGTDDTFLVNLANGTYDVTPTMGDTRYARDQISIYGQGQLLASGLSSSAGQFISPTYQVQVNNGQLELRFVDSGGTTPRWALNGLDIVADSSSTGSSGGGSSSTGGSSQVYAPTTGIYAVGYVNGKIPVGILTNPYVDGYAVRATWSFLEPAPGVYNWAYLDGMINAVASADKKVSLSIAAGINTPAWVYAAGAQSFTYVDTSSPTVQTIPVPWDSTFLTQWTGFIQQLGARYASNPAIAQVKITGIAIDTAETMLPLSTGQSVTYGGKTWKTTNDVADWLAAGYTRTKVENAWQTIADAWSKAFPTQQISAIMVPNHFPPIDGNGNLLTGEYCDSQILNDLLSLGMTRYGTQFVVQNNGLSDSWILPQSTGIADQVTTGYQTLWFVTGDNTYQMNNGKAIAVTTELQTALNAAVASHARFLELYPEDIANPALQGVLAQVHTGLANNARPLGTITGIPAPDSVLEGTNTFTFGSALADPSATSADGFTYDWTVTHNGQTVATGSASSLTLTTNDWGDYNVSLQVTDPAGLSSFVDTQTLTILNVAPTITQLSAPLSVTQGMTATFTAAATDPGPADMAAGLTYTWKFGNGDTATGSSVTYTYKWTGTFNVTLIVADAGGSTSTGISTITVAKPVHSPEGATITLQASSFPAPAGADFSGATYAWTVTANGQTYATGSAANFAFTPDDLSSYVVSLTVTDQTGQSWANFTTYTIDNLPPTVTQYSVPLSTAQGVAVTLSAAATDPGAADMQAGLTYTWKFGNGDTATGNSVSYTYKWSGTYNVVLLVADAEGATTKATSTIIVNKPTHSPEGAAIALTASSFPAPTGVDFSGATYAWTVTKNGKTYATGSAANFTFTPDDLSNYIVTLTVTDKAGQSWTNAALYTIDNLPPTITQMTAPATASQGASVKFAATATDPGQADMSAGLTFTWGFGDGKTATGSSVNHAYDWKGTYTVTLTVSDQEGAKTIKKITIKVT